MLFMFMFLLSHHQVEQGGEREKDVDRDNLGNWEK